VSKYFQHVSMAETTTGGTCFILSTSIGRFKCYEIDDRTFIHFDSGTRSSYVDLIKDQDLNDILRTARGEFQLNRREVDNGFEWCRSTGESLEKLASVQLYGVPNAVIYTTKSTLQRWKRIKEFAYAMLDTVLSVLDGVAEPAEFVSALRNLPPVSDNTLLNPDSLPKSGTPVKNLAASIFFYRTLSRKSIGAMSLEGEFSDVSRIIN
jgi:hypothetical protein